MSDRVLIWILGGIASIAGIGASLGLTAGNAARDACDRVNVAEVRVEAVRDNLAEIRNDVAEIKRDIKALLQR